jgi:hypothetical protein
MNTNDISNPDEPRIQFSKACDDVAAAHERAEAIDKIGTLIAQELKTAIWPGTKEALTEMLKHCYDLYEVASNDLDDAGRREEDGWRAWGAQEAKES